MLMLTFDVFRTATSKPAKLLRWSMQPSEYEKSDDWMACCYWESELVVIA